jgi:hypothetical protein
MNSADTLERSNGPGERSVRQQGIEGTSGDRGRAAVRGGGLQADPRAREDRLEVAAGLAIAIPIDRPALGIERPRGDDRLLKSTRGNRALRGLDDRLLLSRKIAKAAEIGVDSERRSGRGSALTSRGLPTRAGRAGRDSASRERRGRPPFPTLAGCAGVGPTPRACSRPPAGTARRR